MHSLTLPGDALFLEQWLQEEKAERLGGDQTSKHISRPMCQLSEWRAWQPQGSWGGCRVVGGSCGLLALHEVVWYFHALCFPVNLSSQSLQPMF